MWSRIKYIITHYPQNIRFSALILLPPAIYFLGSVCLMFLVSYLDIQISIPNVIRDIHAFFMAWSFFFCFLSGLIVLAICGDGLIKMRRESLNREKISYIIGVAVSLGIMAVCALIAFLSVVYLAVGD